ncbi:hypothetical protein [Polynucleobacter paneuropaeus]|uniref:hypothetical protein n=1 Tax=Polynucleobacter paneuropaeus TaxID=2527775 RepID=UPI0013147BA3|nr:hypothetical protein [Polynucleobacter paneuropaeus]
MNSSDPVVRRNVENSRLFYSKWGDVKNSAFNDWWKLRESLFKDEDVQVLDDTSKRHYSDSLILEIPINKSTSELLKKIKLLIDEEQKSRNRPKKNKVVITTKFKPTDRTEPKLVVLKDVLSVYRDVYLKDSSMKGKKLLQSVHDYYLGRKRKDYRRIPNSINHFESTKKSELDRVTRNLRRWIQWGDKITLNVSKGEFPGRY